MPRKPVTQDVTTYSVVVNGEKAVTAPVPGGTNHYAAWHFINEMYETMKENRS